MLKMAKIEKVELKDDLSMVPLISDHFEDLMEAISDPKIWQNTSFKNRWEKRKREKWFSNALENKYTYSIYRGDKCIGSSRFYDFEDDSVSIGYTFFITSEWGKGANKLVKKFMISHAQKYYSNVFFKIDEQNKQSIKAIEKLGGKLYKTLPKHQQRSDGTWRTTKVYSF